MKKYKNRTAGAWLHAWTKKPIIEKADSNRFWTAGGATARP
jgi:hypothetical protein